jgi:cytochrome c5
MRVRLTLFMVSALLFVSGIGLVVAGARVLRHPVAAEAAALTPVGSVRQIMRGIVDPAATTVFGAVSTTVTAAGVEEKAPTTQAEWDAVADSAAAIAEGGNLLLIGSRVVDDREWTTISRRMIDAGKKALVAAEARNAADVFASGEAIYETCDTCHAKYRRTE